MDALDKARAEIDAVDAQLAALFERRMAAVLCPVRPWGIHILCSVIYENT